MAVSSVGIIISLAESSHWQYHRPGITISPAAWLGSVVVCCGGVGGCPAVACLLAGQFSQRGALRFIACIGARPFPMIILGGRGRVGHRHGLCVGVGGLVAVGRVPWGNPRNSGRRSARCCLGGAKRGVWSCVTTRYVVGTPPNSGRRSARCCLGGSLREPLQQRSVPRVAGA